ncbi:MAG: MBL fold metallo-hydrolase, partial [Chloroflexia bacterium]|nr:MBL fold metallo-hydrolase [Chloroflexia bacterium]
RLFGEPGAEETWFSDDMAIEEYDPTKTLNVGRAEISFAPTVHYVPCWAIRVGGGDSPDLVYTADTGPAANLGTFGRGGGVLVAEAALLEPGAEPMETRGHLTAAEAAALANETGASTLVLTHIWEELEPARFVERAASIFRGRLELARPGVSVSW